MNPKKFYKTVHASPDPIKNRDEYEYEHQSDDVDIYSGEDADPDVKKRKRPQSSIPKIRYETALQVNKEKHKRFIEQNAVNQQNQVK